MKDSKAEKLIGIRIKYDWIVLLLGFICLLIQLTIPINLNYFLFFLGSFIFVEVFEVSVYRKLQKGGEGYHMAGSRRLDQQDDFSSVLICIILELFLLAVASVVFIVGVIKQNAN